MTMRQMPALLLVAVVGCYILAGVSAVATHITYTAEDRLIDDDYLWLYLTGARLGRAEQFDRIVEPVRAAVRKSGKAAAIWESEARLTYQENYIGASVLYRLAAIVGPHVGLVSPASDYPRFFAGALRLGFWVAYLSALALAIAAGLASRRPAVALGVPLSLLLLVGFEYRFTGVNQYLANQESVAEVFRQSVMFFLDPSFNFSPFGVTPRSQFALVALAAFTFRLSGNFTAGYAALAVGGLFHQSYGAMLTSAIFAMDTALRPGVLRVPATAGVAGIAFACGFLRVDALFVSGATTGTLALVVLAALLVWGLISTGLFGAVKPQPALAAAFPWLARPSSDMVLLLAGWVLTLPVVWLSENLLDDTSWLYFWSQLHGRLLGLLRPAVVVIAVVFGLEWAWRRAPRHHVAMAFIAIVVTGTFVLPVVDAAPRLRSGVTELAQLLSSLDQQLDGPPPVGHRRTENERLIYYSLARTLDTGEDWVSKLLSASSGDTTHTAASASAK